jgi:AraC family transcriptional regulator of adaptative response/methylated-DNA-[protein]-cysteine methyltransferase
MASPAAQMTHDPRWAAVCARDASADGSFVYSVRTTGIFCRPSCPARRAKFKNVAFHSNAEAARAAGFRPCKRCNPEELAPDSNHARIVADLCRLIERSDDAMTLEQLARHSGWSAFHTQRVFKSVVGVTPKAYANAHRARRTAEALQRGNSVTEAIYDAGFNSSGRFYEQSTSTLGMAPSTYRAGGVGEEIRFAIGECSLGSILVAATERGVCAILLGDDPDELLHDLEQRFQRATLFGGDVVFEELVSKVIAHVEAPGSNLDLPLDIRGTAFQQRVWQALRQIPAGTTTTYSELARSIGAPAAVRAVGRACALNAIAVAIPCHRVVRNDGGLAGYRWGVERKRALLRRESQRD